MLRDWLDGSGWQPKTRSVYLGDIRTLLEHGRRLRVITRNPAAEVPRPSLVDDGEIAILSVPRCARLLVRASRRARWGFEAGHEFGDLLPYVALGLFGGIRPEEVQRLTWDAIDLVERHVVISGKRAKTRARRVVDLSPNAVAWLCQVPESARVGPVCPPNFRKRWERLRRACGWAIVDGERGQPWPHDALRHSFASYHYAQHRNESLLQTQMGHTSGGVLFRHYRAIATRKQAEAFWGITPPATPPA
jgi:integrase